MIKILIVDDDLTNCSLMKSYLDQYGKCDSINDGFDAIDAVRHAIEIGEPYHVICLDIMMPGMDGNETLEEIRRLEDRAESLDLTSKKSVVIMTTALDDIHTVFQSYGHLCDGYLTKPIRRPDLLKILVEENVISGEDTPK